MLSLIKSPTGRGIRDSDSWGSGHWGASRGGGKKHEGLDFICIPGQQTWMPINGIASRLAAPYANESYSGLLIESENIILIMFYFNPLKSIIGKYLEQGDLIGVAQDISKRNPEKGKYKGMIPHLHVGVKGMNPRILM